MPNWCENKLTITGDEASIKKFSQKRCMHDFIPMPPDTQDWYHWALAHWGTKWDIELKCDHYQPNDQCLFYLFDTAWSPPVEFIKRVALLYPSLYFVLKYDEPSNGFMGCCTAEGKKFNDTIINY